MVFKRLWIGALLISVGMAGLFFGMHSKTHAQECSMHQLGIDGSRPLDRAYVQRVSRQLLVCTKSPVEINDCFVNRRAITGVEWREVSHSVPKNGTVTRIYAVTVADFLEKEIIANGFRANEDVWFVEENSMVATSTYQNDDFVNTVPGVKERLDVIHAPQAWDVATTANGSTIIIDTDTGCDVNHVDIKSNLWQNPGEIPDNGIDDDGNGVVDDVYGYNSLLGTGAVSDDNGHGTGTTSLAAAVGDNRFGISGTCPHVQVMIVKMLDSFGSGDQVAVAGCFQYILMMKSRFPETHMVVTASWIGTNPTFAQKELIAQLNDAGIILVCASGNTGLNIDVTPGYPAAFSDELPNVISVGATDLFDNLAGFSTWSGSGTKVQIVAPGVDILTAYPGRRRSPNSDDPSGYRTWSGTSFATPQVAGYVALMLNDRSLKTVSDIRLRLSKSVDVIEKLKPFVGWGRLNMAKSVTAFSNRPPTANASGVFTGIVGEETTWSVSGSDPDGDPLYFSVHFADDPRTDTFTPIANRTIRKTFAVTGVYQFAIIASDRFAQSAVSFGTIIIREKRPNKPPIALLTVEAGSQNHPTAFFLAGSDPDGDPIVLYTLSYGYQNQRATFTKSQKPTFFTYKEAGTYTATLTVSDGITESAPTAVAFVVKPNQPPRITVQIKSQTVVENTQNVFVVTISDPDGDAVTGMIDFGDGSQKTVISKSGTSEISHAFPKAGEYSVIATVTDGALVANPLIVSVSVVDTVLISATYTKPAKAGAVGSLFIDAGQCSFSGGENTVITMTIVTSGNKQILVQEFRFNSTKAYVQGVIPAGSTLSASSNFGGSFGPVKVQVYKK